MNRLWVRLTLAFALVIAVVVATVALIGGLTAGREFRVYLRSAGMLSQAGLANDLARYYQEQGSWEGVEAVLEAVADQGGMMGRGRGHMMMAGRVALILAGADGRVIYDGAEGSAGRRLTRDEQAAGRDIVVDGQVVGRLVMTLPLNEMMGPLEEAFLARLQRLLVAGALLAGAIGLGLGLAFSRSLSAPLRSLAAAARAVAGHDFSRRVRGGGSTELDEVAHAFNDMAAALEQAEQQRQNLVADVAHELRTPLSVIQGSLQAILDDVYPLDKAEITRLYDETRLLSRLVDDLRELAQADAGRLRLNLQPTDALRVVQSTVDSLSPAAEVQGVALAVEAPRSVPPVHADPDRLAQVVRNLLVNALRHTPAGGSVTVTLSTPGADGAVEVAVTDTGEGIAPEDLPHVFDRFWRADRARTRDGRAPGGSGLGLSIAKSLVEAQGGRISAWSTPGRETTFRFTLPTESEHGGHKGS